MEANELAKVVEGLKASTHDIVDKYNFHSQQALTDIMAAMVSEGIPIHKAEEIAKSGSKSLITGMAVVSTLHAEAVLHVAAEFIPDARLKEEFAQLIDEIGIDWLKTAIQVEPDDSAE